MCLICPAIFVISHHIFSLAFLKHTSTIIFTRLSGDTMSNIYILEPPTNGKVLLETSAGPIEIELWSKEAPKASRNFVQHCLDGYFDKTIFHRVVKGFLVQGGDPTGTGNGGESIYGHPFKDEFHSRLRFVRRGLVAMASTEPDDNRSQFFFTLDKCPELTNKNTIFGKIVGDTIYNMLTLGEANVDFDERPYHPQKIVRTKVLNNPFSDLTPRVTKTSAEASESSKSEKSSSRATKNFSLLSFGEEAADDEEEFAEATEKFERSKGKSSHDLANDPRLLNIPAIDTGEKSEDSHEDSDEPVDRSVIQNTKAASARLAGALKKAVDDRSKGPATKTEAKSDEDDESDEDVGRKAVQEEIAKLKKELVHGNKSAKEEKEEAEKAKMKDSALLSWSEERTRYRQQMESTGSQLKGAAREKATLDLLSKFQSKLRTATAKLVDFDEEEESEEEEKVEEGAGGSDDISWMRQPLVFKSEDDTSSGVTVKVIDASAVKVDEERYSILDPRNPLNKRRREAGKSSKKHKRAKDDL